MLEIAINQFEPVTRQCPAVDPHPQTLPTLPPGTLLSKKTTREGREQVPNQTNKQLIMSSAILSCTLFTLPPARSMLIWPCYDWNNEDTGLVYECFLWPVASRLIAFTHIRRFSHQLHNTNIDLIAQPITRGWPRRNSCFHQTSKYILRP